MRDWGKSCHSRRHRCVFPIIFCLPKKREYKKKLEYVLQDVCEFQRRLPCNKKFIWNSFTTHFVFDLIVESERRTHRKWGGNAIRFGNKFTRRNLIDVKKLKHLEYRLVEFSIGCNGRSKYTHTHMREQHDAYGFALKMRFVYSLLLGL